MQDPLLPKEEPFENTGLKIIDKATEWVPEILEPLRHIDKKKYIINELFGYKNEPERLSDGNHNYSYVRIVEKNT